MTGYKHKPGKPKPGYAMANRVKLSAQTVADMRLPPELAKRFLAVLNEMPEAALGEFGERIAA